MLTEPSNWSSEGTFSSTLSLNPYPSYFTHLQGHLFKNLILGNRPNILLPWTASLPGREVDPIQPESPLVLVELAFQVDLTARLTHGRDSHGLERPIGD